MKRGFGFVLVLVFVLNLTARLVDQLQGRKVEAERAEDQIKGSKDRIFGAIFGLILRSKEGIVEEVSLKLFSSLPSKHHDG